MLSDSQLAEAPRAWLIDGAADLLASRGWDASRRQAVDGEKPFAAALLGLISRPILAQPAACCETMPLRRLGAAGDDR